MRGLLGSLRYTTRFLLKSPGFTVTAVLILGFGIGVNTAIFGLINAVILKPLPFAEPGQLVQISQPYQSDPSQVSITRITLISLERNTHFLHWQYCVGILLI
jgi:hypothetical protein